MRIPGSKTILAFAAIAVIATSCKTTEANYKAAYERAVERKNEGIDSTVYDAIRREAKPSVIAIDGGVQLPLVTEHVSVTPDNGNTSITLKRYCIVVGKFKQIFNARSMRTRLASSGNYPDAFIVQIREPLYYVIAATADTPQDAAAALQKVRNDQTLMLREPLPWVLQPTSLAR